MSGDGDQAEQELERTLGLGSALSIGIGTMIGAGVFVFPGLAAGRAGAGAMVSFAIGTVVALLVALPASELATAMPRSGGAYHFVSRGLGAWAGTVAGIGQWIGLIFASAFYLVGFGHYFVDGLGHLGLALTTGPASGVLVVAVTAAVLLLLVNIRGTEHAGELQSMVVMILLVLLAAIILYGSWSLARGRSAMPARFAPTGWPGILRTAALVFTSYLGFVQIASVGGEI